MSELSALRMRNQINAESREVIKDREGNEVGYRVDLDEMFNVTRGEK